MNPEEIVRLIALTGSLGVELYLKLKAISELGPDEQANIHRAISEGIQADQEMKQKYSDWRASVGLPPLPELPPPSGGPGTKGEGK